MSNRDATPSWSGFIFQGEVALCRAIEEINKLDDDIPDHYCLKLEEEEDFSITTDEKINCQVKAYTKHNYTKYKIAWDTMMGEFSETPGNNFLYTQKGDFENDRFKPTLNPELKLSNIKAGIYTLENIDRKIRDCVKSFIGDPEMHNEQINNKCCFVCSKIAGYVKERHRTKEVREISFKEIIDWINQAPSAFNEEIAWYSIEKMFFKTLINLSIDVDSLGDEKEYLRLIEAISELEKLNTQQIKQLFIGHINSHVDSGLNDLEKFGDYMSASGIERVVGRALRLIDNPLIFNKLQYNWTDDELIYQLTINSEVYDHNDTIDQINLRKLCERLKDKLTTQEIDFYVTQNISVDKIKMNEMLESFIESDDENEEQNIILKNDNFGFMKVGCLINKFEPQ